MGLEQIMLSINYYDFKQGTEREALFQGWQSSIYGHPYPMYTLNNGNGEVVPIDTVRKFNDILLRSVELYRVKHEQTEK